MPRNVGGRFSVLTAVGLLPAAFLGLDVDALLRRRARHARSTAGRAPPERNVGVLGAVLLHLMATQARPQHPGADAVRRRPRPRWPTGTAALGGEPGQALRPARAESCETGQTPVTALGATDQHSQVQLYMEGPHDKVVTFLEVEAFRPDVRIPRRHPDLASLGYLGGRTLGELLNAERRGTEIALTVRGPSRPSRTCCHAIDAHVVGQLIYLFEFQTALSRRALRHRRLRPAGRRGGQDRGLRPHGPERLREGSAGLRSRMRGRRAVRRSAARGEADSRALRCQACLRSFVVGTAGHIDHGKSALVQALTGTDPDRLEGGEGARHHHRPGLRAPRAARTGRWLSFVDVPGHERFVRNMLAGAHGIDAVVLVVAADESVMPQTREHFHICRLLGIPRGLVALTKCDLADADAQAVAEMEARELVAGSFLEGAPVVRVSARTGMGLDALTRELALSRKRPRRPPRQGLLRLPVDRSFTLRGLRDRRDRHARLRHPVGWGTRSRCCRRAAAARVRGLQVHGAARGARRGGQPGGRQPGRARGGGRPARPGAGAAGHAARDVDDRRRAVAASGRAAAADHGARVRVHLASAEALARVHVSGRGADRTGRDGARRSYGSNGPPWPLAATGW